MKEEGLNWNLEQFESFCTKLLSPFQINIDRKDIIHTPGQINAAAAVAYKCIKSVVAPTNRKGDGGSERPTKCAKTQPVQTLLGKDIFWAKLKIKNHVAEKTGDVAKKEIGKINKQAELWEKKIPVFEAFWSEQAKVKGGNWWIPRGEWPKRALRSFTSVMLPLGG